MSTAGARPTAAWRPPALTGTTVPPHPARSHELTARSAP
ncbi:MAG: hypothetical protein QOF58_8277 [Pseudonocardiales bacterium]|jgi:hypothetical protein|nr:hypothetical protein [Pseudonocardiales bacterium]